MRANSRGCSRNKAPLPDHHDFKKFVSHFQMSAPNFVKQHRKMFASSLRCDQQHFLSPPYKVKGVWKASWQFQKLKQVFLPKNFNFLLSHLVRLPLPLFLTFYAGKKWQKMAIFILFYFKKFTKNVSVDFIALFETGL